MRKKSEQAHNFNEQFIYPRSAVIVSLAVGIGWREISQIVIVSLYKIFL
jgi:hypothetical protein